MDALFRQKGTVKQHSLISESFTNNLLDNDCFTKSKSTPDELLLLKSGDHNSIEDWKLRYKIFKTAFFREDLLFNFIKKKINFPQEKNVI